MHVSQIHGTFTRPCHMLRNLIYINFQERTSMNSSSGWF